MPVATYLVQVLLFVGFAFFGRWLSLHPEKVPLEGSFTNAQTLGARLFRAGITLIGTLAVFGGVLNSLETTFSFFSVKSSTFSWIMHTIAFCCGIGAAIYVRTEVRARPEHVPKNPHGWWP